jgi:hypothetical protein
MPCSLQSNSLSESALGSLSESALGSLLGSLSESALGSLLLGSLSSSAPLLLLFHPIACRTPTARWGFPPVHHCIAVHQRIQNYAQLSTPRW